MIALLYHRVTHLASDPQLLAVTPEHFEEHLEALRPIAAEVMVTFDDGYADNFYQAAPLLRRFGISATIFATTGCTDRRREFFWDELERVFLRDDARPRGPALNGGWNVLLPTEPGSREEMYRDWCGKLHGVSVDRREELLADLRKRMGTECTSRESHRMMTSDELRELDREGLIEIGAHTVMHPLLAAETPVRQEEEIVGGKRNLEDILGRTVRRFSYPFGGRRDYSSETVRIVRRAGFESAYSNFPGRITPQTDRLQQPRFLVRDWDGAEFTRRLSAWRAAA